ncbi:MAG: hypothetical protein C4527_21855 [Candidatus Omnitrophota bacterium]|nr:MAG: hypothetical protein C4527_21855 [Candidatus Omnitrophota bacterium]
MKTITLSIRDNVLEAGQEYARRHNISFDDLISKLIEETVVRKKSLWLDEMFSLMDKANVKSETETWSREDLYRV